MAKSDHLHVAASNEISVFSAGDGRKNLRLINTQESALAQEKPVSQTQNATDTVRTWQAMLRAESAFLTQLRGYAEGKSKYAQDAGKMRTLRARLNSENVMDLARFFFLLKELKCDKPDAVEALLKAHNDTIRTMIETEQFTLRTEGELKKAAFSGRQIYECLETIGFKPRAAFTRRDIASLLFEHMGRDSVLRAIDVMVEAGLLIESVYAPIKGADRKLIHTDGFLEKATKQYLADVKRGIMEGS